MAQILMTQVLGSVDLGYLAGFCQMEHMQAFRLPAALQRCRDLQKTLVAGDYGLFMRYRVRRDERVGGSRGSSTTVPPERALDGSNSVAQFAFVEQIKLREVSLHHFEFAGAAS